MSPQSNTKWPMLLTVQQVQDELQVGRSTIYRLVQSGELASVSIGRARRIPRHAVEALIDRQLADPRGGVDERR